MKYPVKVSMPPAIMKGVDKTWIVAGCMIQVPNSTTKDDIANWVTYTPPASTVSTWIPSSRGGSYKVSMRKGGQWSCGCDGYKFYRKCRHINKAKLMAA